MRRILENYFVSYSGRSLNSLVEGVDLMEHELILFQSLFLSLNRDSHVVSDGFIQTHSEEEIDRAKHLFRRIFELHGQEQHHDMMMQLVNTDD